MNANTSNPPLTLTPAPSNVGIDKPKRKRLSRPEIRARKEAEAKRTAELEKAADAVLNAPDLVQDATTAPIVPINDKPKRTRARKTAAAVAASVEATAANAATITEDPKPVNTDPYLEGLLGKDPEATPPPAAPKGRRSRKVATAPDADNAFIPPLPVPENIERTTKVKPVSDAELLGEAPAKAPAPAKSKDRLNITDVYNALKKMGGKATAKEIAASASWEAVRVHGALLALRTHGAVSYAEKVAKITGNLPAAPEPKVAGKRGPKPGAKKAGKDAALLD